jgi:hypothetical protein
MSRIRTIKPEFFSSDDIVSMSPLARLFYVSLWCESDREGRMEWKPSTFKLRYLPGDSCDVHVLAQELVVKGLIILYTVDGKQYAEIPTFTEHQVINNRESQSLIPSRHSDASGTRQARVKAEGKEGKEGKDSNNASSPPAPATFNPVEELAAHGVTSQTAGDWLKLRKQKKAIVTATALGDIVKQADKANMTLERALTISCRRGWTGFEASWLKPEDLAPPAGPAARDYL